LFLELPLAGATQGHVGSLSHITQRCSLHIRLSFHSVLSQAADGSNGEKCSQRDGEPDCLGQIAVPRQMAIALALSLSIR
jgi:hypothetical protein